MQANQISEELISKVISEGGGFLPVVNAFDSRAWEILLGLSSDQIGEHIKTAKVPFKQIGRNRWFTPSDFWASFDYTAYE